MFYEFLIFHLNLNHYFENPGWVWFNYFRSFQALARATRLVICDVRSFAALCFGLEVSSRALSNATLLYKSYGVF